MKRQKYTKASVWMRGFFAACMAMLAAHLMWAQDAVPPPAASSLPPPPTVRPVRGFPFSHAPSPVASTNSVTPVADKVPVSGSGAKPYPVVTSPSSPVSPAASVASDALAPSSTNASAGTAAVTASFGKMQPVQLVAAPIGDETAKAPALKFENAPSEMVLKAYALETGRTLLFAPDAPKANITLTSQTSLNRHEYLQAIQTVLVMNNIALLPVGDKFLKVVPAVNVRQRAIETLFQEPADGFHDEVGEMISQMVQLKYISMDEAKTTIDSFKSTSGLIQLFERTGSILITDTAENVNRMREIIQFIDQPHVVREEVNVRAIRYAKAATIKQRLEEIIAESLKAQQGSKESPSAKMSGSPGMGRTTTPLPLPVPGVVVRATPPASVTPASSPIIEALMADAERGMIRGKVQIIADERTNMLIIITQPENMSFFDRIISVLDVETAPDIDVKVYRLEYADAEPIDRQCKK